MNDINSNGSKFSSLFTQIAGQLVLAGILAGIVIYGTVSVLGVRIEILQEMLTEMRDDTVEIRNNYARRAEVDPRFTRIENQVDAIYRDMARLEKKVE